MSYIRDELRYLKKSFKFKRNNYLALAYDCIMFAILIVVGYFFLRLTLNLAFSSKPFIDFSFLTNNNPEIFQIYISLILGTIIFAFIASGIYSLFKYLIWNNILEQNFHKKGFVKYFFINFILFLALIILEGFFVLQFHYSGLIVAVYLGIFFSHFSTFFQLHYIKHKSFKKALIIAIKKGLKVHEFLFIYLTIGMFFYVYLYLYAVFNQFVLFGLIPIFIILMIFWLRNYFSKRHDF